MISKISNWLANRPDKLIKKYGISPLFNYAEQVSPVLSHKGKIRFSPSNYLFEPHPSYPVDSFENKNRHPWSYEEIKKLQEEALGAYVITPTGYQVLLLELPDMETINGITRNRSYDLGQVWSIGKIIGMGESCFDHYKFPFGARATFNDWVFYKKAETTRIDMRKGALLTVTDCSIQSLAPDLDKLIAGV
jgi:hypothetical protein